MPIPAPGLRRPVTVAAAALVIAAVAVAAWRWWTPAPLSQADGERWSIDFVDRATGPELLGARGPATFVVLSKLVPPTEIDDRNAKVHDNTTQAGCVTWHTTRWPAPSVMTTRDAHLSSEDGSPCETMRVTVLAAFMHRTGGITPAVFLRALTARFGPPRLERTPEDATLYYRWRPTFGLITLWEGLTPDDTNAFTLDVRPDP